MSGDAYTSTVATVAGLGFYNAQFRRDGSTLENFLRWQTNSSYAQAGTGVYWKYAWEHPRWTTHSEHTVAEYDGTYTAYLYPCNISVDH